MCVVCIHLVQGESGLAAHVLEQQLGDLQLLPTTGVVQRRVASLSAHKRLYEVQCLT